jgi:hypothetical protein
MTYRTAIAVFVLSLSVAPIVAQSSTQTDYDRAWEKAIAGTIKAVATFRDPAGAVGVHLDLETRDGLVNVHLAPAMFIGEKNFWFGADEQVEIIGSRMVHDGNTAVWAKAIQKGSALLVLRTAEGTPLWTPPTDGADGCGVDHAPLPRGTER